MVAALAVLVSGLGLPVVQAADKPPKVWVPPKTALPNAKAVKGSNAKSAVKDPAAGKAWKPAPKSKTDRKSVV